MLSIDYDSVCYIIADELTWWRKGAKDTGKYSVKYGRSWKGLNVTLNMSSERNFIEMV